MPFVEAPRSRILREPTPKVPAQRKEGTSVASCTVSSAEPLTK
jgi:hypothetical protein